MTPTTASPHPPQEPSAEAMSLAEEVLSAASRLAYPAATIERLCNNTIAPLRAEVARLTEEARINLIKWTQRHEKIEQDNTVLEEKLAQSERELAAARMALGAMMQTAVIHGASQEELAIGDLGLTTSGGLPGKTDDLTAQRDTAARAGMAEELADMLDTARTGLIWYRSAHPEDDSEADDEVEEKIEALLARYAALPKGRL